MKLSSHPGALGRAICSGQFPRVSQERIFGGIPWVCDKRDKRESGIHSDQVSARDQQSATGPSREL